MCSARESPNPANEQRIPHQQGDRYRVELDSQSDVLAQHAFNLHLRERGYCFYCLRRLPLTVRCLDHVVPRAHSGRNSYRNLVSACLECNTHKGEKPAEDFLRWLYRQRRLTAAELTERLRALAALAAGKLRPEDTAAMQDHIKA